MILYYPGDMFYVYCMHSDVDQNVEYQSTRYLEGAYHSMGRTWQQINTNSVRIQYELTASEYIQYVYCFPVLLILSTRETHYGVFEHLKLI